MTSRNAVLKPAGEQDLRGSRKEASGSLKRPHEMACFFVMILVYLVDLEFSVFM